MRTLRAVGAGLVALMLLSELTHCVVEAISPPTPEPAPSMALTPLSASEAAQAAAKRASSVRYYSAVIAAKLVKNAQRNPASVTWQDVGVNDDGSVVCMVYRSQNGFGGKNVEYAISAKGKITSTVANWNRYCKGSLYKLEKEVTIALASAE